ncbi:hypothetical protein A3F37_04085 [Candidatus Saccharibacteria bacterium RIFCSPHIGHO2_12_FULL_41_12]|nr:MAG: hypothetical protein A3F37_04085 [Candidatus Saccharibacteria bacterium RIFCSPHIGHO2_12_FULL_41_12]
MKGFKDQLDGEEVLFVFRKHPIVMRKGLIFASVALVIGVLPSLVKPEYSVLIIGFLVGFIMAIAVMLPFWITWYYSVFIVTDQRFVQLTQKGLWNKSVVDIALPQIQMVNYEVQGLEETMLGFGTIMMQTFVGDLVIHDIHHPETVQKTMLSVLREKGYIGAINSNFSKGNDETIQEDN